jgi:two-component system sensor histidine kinase VicK
MENEMKTHHGSDKHYAGLIEGLPIGVLLVDEKERIEVCTRAAEGILGYPKGEIEGALFSDYFYNPYLLNAFHVVPPQTRFEVEKEDGSSSSIELRFSNVDIDGTPHRICQLYDITHEKKLEEEQKMFMSSIIHDWGNALTVLKSLADMSLATKSEEYRQMLVRNVDKLYRMWKEVRDFRELKRETYTFSECDMREIVDTVLHDYAPQFEKERITVENRIPDGMPVRCDADKMARVWDNLVSNAIKYSLGEDHTNRVEIGLNKNNGVYEFFIKDTGIGIDPTAIASLGKPYVRLQEKLVDGSGVGLATVNEILAKHDGEMRIASEGQSMGATVYIRLPSHEKHNHGYCTPC